MLGSYCGCEVKEYSTLVDLPMPPTSNNQYRSFVRDGKVRHVSSPELKAFKQNMWAYSLQHSQKIKTIRPLMINRRLCVSAIFNFFPESIFCKDGRVKKMDVSNRLKSLHDCLNEILEIDDSYIFKVHAEKRQTVIRESVTVLIHPI